jgi:alkylated DNA repair dioxygenase AlkB
MAVLHQPSMFDVLLEDSDEPRLGPLVGSIRRTGLSDGAWVDHCPGWLTGSDAVLDTLLALVPWRAEQRQMYDRTVAVPRLLCWYTGADPFPHPALDSARQALNEHYRPRPGRPVRHGRPVPVPGRRGQCRLAR